jgi:hypothetical protein
MCLFSQEWKELNVSFIEIANFLTKYWWRQITWVLLTKGNHSLLATILWAAKQEDTLWWHTVLDEKFGLVSSLREVLNYNSWTYFISQRLNQSQHSSIIRLATKSVLLDEVVVLNNFCVSSFAHFGTERWFAWTLRPNQKADLWEHSLTSQFPNLHRVPTSVYRSYFSELFVKLNYCDWLLIVCLKSLVNDFLCVIWAAACFRSFQASGDANFNRSVEVKNALGLSYYLLKVDSLVNGSRESINKVVLINGYYQ